MSHLFGGLASAALPLHQGIICGIQEHGSWAVVHATPELRADREFILNAVGADGEALMYAAEPLKSDRELVLAAVSQNGHALRHAHPDFASDRDFVLEAVAFNGDAICHAAAPLREDKQFLIAAVKVGATLYHIPAKFRKELTEIKDGMDRWENKRQNLLENTQIALAAGDLKSLLQVLTDGEDHQMPESDLAELRRAFWRADKYNYFDTLFDSLEVHGTAAAPAVALIRGSWLVSLAEKGGRLPRRQDLPAEAAWGAQELRKHIEEYETEARHLRPPPVVVVSHCWFRTEHPDPHSMQLKTLSGLIRGRMRALEPGSAELAIYIDYCSIFQEPCTEAEAACREESLNYVNLLYAHAKTEKWLLTRSPPDCSLPSDIPTSSVGPTAAVLPYAARGWPSFERALAVSLTSGRGCVIDTGNFVEDGPDVEWSEIQRQCSVQRGPPKEPNVFCDELAQKTFTHVADLATLQQIYRKTFDEIIAQRSWEVFSFCGLNWHDEEAATLGETLRTCSSVRSVILDRNDIGDQGAWELMDAITNSSSRIERLSLNTNSIGDLGIQRVAEHLPNCKHLKMIDLSFNAIGNAGLQLLASLLERSDVCPTLRELHVAGNDSGSLAKTQLEFEVN